MERAYPLQWPADRPRTPYEEREDSRFDVTPDRAQRDMRHQIEMMGGEDIIVSTNQRVRRDGMIYAADLGRTPDDPGVAVYFKRKDRRMCFACDQYPRIWENMRAIGKTIRALRGIERWGSHEMMDRAFTGFAALPPPDPSTLSVAPTGPDQLPPPWHEVLGVEPTAAWSEIRTAYREKMREADEAEQYRLNNAYDMARAAAAA